MKKYQSYKQSGIEWIGEVPESWNSGKMKYVLSNNDGGVWGTDTEDEEEGTLVVRSTEITIEGNWDLSQILKRNLTENEVSKCKLYEGDIVITKSSGSPQHIGKSVIVSKEIEELNCCYSNFVQRIRFKDYNSKLYHYILNSDIVREQFKYLTTSSTGLGNLNGTSLNDVLLPFIPLQEQLQIVQFLDEKTELIDKLISTKERKITLLKEQRTLLINQVVTKGLNPNVKMKDSGVEWIGEIPDDWGVKKFTFITDTINCGYTSTPEYVDEGVMFLSSQNVKKGKLDLWKYNFISNELHNELTKIRKVKKGDLLVVRVGVGIGNSCVVDIDDDFSIYVSLTHVRLKDGYLNYYFNFLFNSSNFIDECLLLSKQGGGVGNFNIKDFERFKFPIPSYLEQNQIVEHLDTKNKEIDDLVHLEQKKIDLLKEYRQSLISEVVTGKIKVTTDE
jgi:type I restriction enzyme S subunit